MTYELSQMVRDTKVDRKIVDRILHLVSSYTISIKATMGRDKDDTFVARCDNQVLTRYAVLQVNIIKGTPCNIAVDFSHKPSDYMAKIAEILTKYGENLKKY